jgi:hypothetical protein
MNMAMRKQRMRNPTKAPMTMEAISPAVIVEQVDPLTIGMATELLLLETTPAPTHWEIMFGVILMQLVKFVELSMRLMPVMFRLVHGMS